MKAAIFLNSPSVSDREVDADTVICADGGYFGCHVVPDVIIGDFDSLPGDPKGIKTIRYGREKNETDSELCVLYAMRELSADAIDFYGVLGGRYDHTLGNFACMHLAKTLGAKAVARENGLDIYLSSGRFELEAQKGDIISVVPYGGNALVKNYSGLDYPLVNLNLTPHDTRGISNNASGGTVTLDIAEGNALIFHYFVGSVIV